MYAIHCTTIECTYYNHGQHCEQMLAYTLTGEIRRSGKLPYYMSSDIPEYHMSVKSSGATLASAKVMMSDTYEGQFEEFFNRTASTCFAYVSMDNIAYVMDTEEFKDFVRHFGRFYRESTKNGGGYKIQLLKESSKMLKYFAERISAPI